MKKLLLTALLVLALLVLPAATWAESVKYLDENGVEQTVSAERFISIEDDYRWKTGWYVIKRDLEISNRIDTISEDVRLILCDGVTLYAKKGISVIHINGLTIYAQSTGDNMGRLIATGTGGDAGIGGDLGIGILDSGSVTINGGFITATGGEMGGAGIGGGASNQVGGVGGYGDNKGGNGGVVTINGGIVTAEGKNGAAAIGGGHGSERNGAPGSLYFKPADGKGIFATNLSNNTQIGGFARSDNNHISQLEKVTSARFELYNKAAVDAVQEKITALPDPGRYTPGDSAVDDRILDAKSAYDSLTDADQRFVSDEHKNRLNTLLKKLGKYTMLDGNGQSVVVGTAAALTFRASGPFDWFAGIRINGKEVSRDSYTAKSGSTIVTLNPGYVASLSVGKYALSIRYTDGGSADAHFRVVSADPPVPADTPVPVVPNLPQTGDGSHLLLWLALTALGALGAAALLAGKRPRRK